MENNLPTGMSRAAGFTLFEIIDDEELVTGPDNSLNGESGSLTSAQGTVKVRRIETSSLDSDRVEKLNQSGKLIFLETTGKTQRLIANEQALSRLGQHGNLDNLQFQIEGGGFLSNCKVVKDDGDIFNTVVKPALQALADSRKRYEPSEDKNETSEILQQTARNDAFLARKRIEQMSSSDVSKKGKIDVDFIARKMAGSALSSATNSIVETNKESRKKEAEQRKQRLEDREEHREIAKEERARPAATKVARQNERLEGNEQVLRRRTDASERLLDEAFADPTPQNRPIQSQNNKAPVNIESTQDLQPASHTEVNGKPNNKSEIKTTSQMRPTPSASYKKQEDRLASKARNPSAIQPGVTPTKPNYRGRELDSGKRIQHTDLSKKPHGGDDLKKAG